MKPITILFLVTLLGFTFSQQCHQLCEDCSSGTCSACYTDFLYNSPAIPASTCSCPIGYYSNSNSCNFCPIRCLECTSYTVCTSCINGYQLTNQNLCVPGQTYIDRWVSTQIQEDLSPAKLMSNYLQGFAFGSGTGFASSASQYFVDCSGVDDQPFLGGFPFNQNASIFRSYYGLPYHQWAQVRFQLIAIDQWQNNSILLELNDVPSYETRTIEGVQSTFSRTYDSSIRNSNLCLLSDQDNLGIMEGNFQHNNSMAKIRIRTSLLNNATASNGVGVFFGIREVLFRIGTCSNDCLRCLSPTKCLECKPLYYNDIGRCICNTTIAFQTNFGCHPLCQPGTFQIVAQGSSCLLCELFIPGCFSCSNQSTCTTCNNGSYLLNGRCTRKCPIGYTQNMTNSNLCQQCDDGCRSCEGNICLKCLFGYYRHEGQCHSSCPDGTYADVWALLCKPCNPTCQTCSSYHTCESCANSVDVNFTLIDGSCIVECEGYIYPDFSLMSISDFDLYYNYYDCYNITCDDDCQSCFGPDSNQCKTCKDDKLLYQYQCQSECPEGSFEDGIICKDCPFSCSLCTEYQCQDCTSGFFLHRGECLIFCPVGFYYGDKECLKCSDNCSRCVSDSSCISCHAGWVLHQGECFRNTTCPQTEYYDRRIGTCASCPQNCSTCFRTLCKTCQSGFYLDNGKCSEMCSDEKIKTSGGVCLWSDPLCQTYPDQENPTCIECAYLDPKLALMETCRFECPRGYTVNSTSGTCVACPTDCIRCSLVQCYRCISGMFVHNHDLCVTQCPDNYASDNVQCISCPERCKKCQPDGSCSECENSTLYIDATLIIDATTKQCVSCPMNQYLSFGNQCSPCSSDCSSCLGSSTNCNSCSNGMFLESFNCVSNCSRGYFKDNPSQQCRKCKPQCKQCQIFDTCTQCDNQLFLFEGRCVGSCQNGWYLSEDTKKCQTCSSNCRTCYGPLPDQCLDCYQGDVLDHTRCLNQCPINRYQDQYGHCDWCHQSCTRCYGPAEFQCHDCNNNYKLYLGQCYEICPAATYLVSNTSNICRECQWGCASCSNQTVCTQCFGGFYLHNGYCQNQCPSRFYGSQHNQTCISCSQPNCSHCVAGGCIRCQFPAFRFHLSCLDNCPAGTFPVFHFIRQCLTCPSKCLRCSKWNRCQSCADGYYLKNNICTNKCPIREYFSLSAARCLDCPGNCESCISSSECSSCENGYHLNPTMNCVNNCPNGYYSESSGYCQSCPNGCSSCQSFDNCTACRANYILQQNRCVNNTSNCPTLCAFCADEDECLFCQIPRFLYNGTCVSFCPIDHYSEGRQCKRCSSRCTSCYDLNNCTTCKPNLSLLNNTCVVNCPVGYYSNDAGSCRRCSSNCQLCTDLNTCFECIAPSKLINGYCNATCPLGTFYSEDDQNCFNCTDGCSQCRSDEICTKCDPSLYLFNGSCIINCPTNHTISNGSICSPCEFPCLSCGGSSDSCLRCIHGYSLIENQCVRHCPSGYFSQNGQCSQCSSSCQKCISNSSNCISCPPGTSLLGSQCLFTCPSGTWSFNSQCIQCSPYCLKCDSQGACTECTNLTILFNNRCIPNCPGGTYNNSMQCEVCTAPCLTCFGHSIYECNTCITGHFLFNDRCLQECPQGYFRDNNTFACKHCHANCSTCTSSDNCTQCVGTLTLDANNHCGNFTVCDDQNCLLCTTTSCEICIRPFYLSNGMCVATCPQSTFASAGVCQNCESDCVICSVAEWCDTCVNSSVVFNGQCLSQCPSGTSNVSNVCVVDPCLVKITITFLTAQTSFCLRCVSPFSLFLSTCLETCPNNTYKAAESCVECPPTCLTCISSSECTSCINTHYLYQSQCYHNCPSGTASNATAANFCGNCPTTCLTCSHNLNGSTECHECAQGFFNFNSQCHDSCPEGTYPDSIYKECRACRSNCIGCFNQTTCFNCNSLTVLFEGKCISDCPVSFYTSTSQCFKCADKCFNCSDASTCIQCQTGYYLVDSECRQNCLSGYILVIDECINCVSPCLQCLNQPHHCTQCIDGTYLINGVCLNQCPIGYYQSTIGQCYECSPICAQCQTAADICTVCVSGYQLVSSTGNCFQNCTSTTQYFDPVNHTCHNCSPDCYSCYGPGYDRCLSCQNNLVLYNRVCVRQCPPGLYDDDAGICQWCNFWKCLLCVGHPDNCSTCANGYILSNGTCIANCADGTYSHNGQCRNCHTNCSTCRGPLSSDCNSCAGGRILMHTGKCSDNCPSPSLIMVGNICQPCGGSCLECNPNGCTLCSNNTYLSAGQCVTSCPPGTYVNASNCINCPADCLQCLTGNTCSICQSGLFLHMNDCVSSCPVGYVSINGKCIQQVCNGINFNNSCVTNCPIGYYQSTVAGVQTCVSCQFRCDRCSSSSDCSQCSINYKLINSICVEDCPTNYVQINSECIPCHSSCGQCILTPTQCTHCLDPLLLYNEQCLTNCPIGYYAELMFNTCQRCSNQCSTCDDSGNCISCKNTAYIPPACTDTTCSTTQYRDTAGNCFDCDDSCSTCYGGSAANCETCFPNFYLINGQCRDTCPVGSYASLNRCFECSPRCVECANANDCSLCQSPFILHNNQCISHCSSLNGGTTNYQLINSQCQPCSLNCQICINTTTCSKCMNNKYLYDGVCEDQCPSTTLPSTIGTCTSCSPCLTCTNTNTNCTSCPQGQVLQGNQCLSSCLSGFYQVANSCTQCSATNCNSCPNDVCQSCNAPFIFANGNCDQCISGYILIAGSCQQCPTTCLNCNSIDSCSECYSGMLLINGQCQFNCPNSYYRNGSSCLPCSSNCLRCMVPTQCQACQANYLLSDGSCTNSCPLGTFATTISCQQCPSQCLSCTSPTNCQTCASTFILHNSECVSQCPAGSTSDGTNCVSCRSGCKECSALTACQKCEENLIAHADGSCVPINCNCLPNQFCLQTLNQCIDCHPSCQQCTGGGISDCTECSSEYTITPSGRCQSQCNTNQYKDITTNTCVPCSNQCLTCNSNGCTSCPTGQVLQTNGQCQTSCPVGSYLYNSICSDCPPLCASCTSSTRCQTCVSTANFFYNEMCYTSCPPGSFTSNPSTCQGCPSNCLTCDSLTTCTSCIATQFLHNNQCLGTCPPGTFRETNTNVCSSCASNCSQCNSANNCFTCTNPMHVIENGICSTSCPATKYADATSNCQSCISPCVSCTSQTACSSCISGYTLVGDICTNNCPEGQFMNSLSQCQNCLVTNCKSCDASTCFECISDYFLFNNDMECRNGCGPGYYPIGRRCQSCINNCDVCDNPIACSNCTSPYKLYNGTCHASCLDYTYTSNDICLDCSQNCIACVNSNLCSQCEAGKFLFVDICVNNCPIAYYSDPNNHCQMCQTRCRVCTDSSVCTQCQSGYVLHSSNCRGSCPLTFYEVNGVCEPCIDNCDRCTNSNSCNVCTSPYFFFNGGCQASCPDYTYDVNNVCLDCSQYCLTCVDSSVCSECQAGKFLFFNVCVNNCSIFYYSDMNNRCQMCQSNCQVCTDSQICNQCTVDYFLMNGDCVHDNCRNCTLCINNICEQCDAEFFLFGDSCSQSCPTDIGLYGNTTTKRCQSCIENCLVCSTGSDCDACIPDYTYTPQTGCVDDAFLEFGVFANMSGFTSNITEITSAVYLGTAIGPMVFGEMSTTYFNLQFCQLMLFHDNQAGDNQQMKTFLNSLKSMSLSTTAPAPTQNNSSRLLQDTASDPNSSYSFLSANLYIFILVGSFLFIYLTIWLVAKALPTCTESCPNFTFYAGEICKFLQNRFLWIYFDFVMWISYLPFMYFALIQLKNFSFSTFQFGLSSLLSIVIIIIYPLYPALICYFIKSNYTDLCLETNTLVEMSLSPYVYKVKRPQQIPEQNQFRYFTRDNFIFFFYPLKYIRKFLVVMVLALCPIPVASVSILIVLNIMFIGYLLVLKPRKMPYLVFDLIIEFVILGFEIFMLVYLSLDASRVTAMSIVTQAVGFITANLSIVIAIILNLIAYYHIFMCIYDLIQHLKEKAQEKQKKQNQPFEDVDDYEEDAPVIPPDDKELPMRKIRNDDSGTEEDQDSIFYEQQGDIFDEKMGPVRKFHKHSSKEDENQIPNLRASTYKNKRKGRKRQSSKITPQKEDHSDEFMEVFESEEMFINKVEPSSKYKRKLNDDDKLLEGGNIKDIETNKNRRTNLLRNKPQQEDPIQLDLTGQQLIGTKKKRSQEIQDPDYDQGNFKDRKNVGKSHPPVQEIKNLQEGKMVNNPKKISNNKGLPENELPELNPYNRNIKGDQSSSQKLKEGQLIDRKPKNKENPDYNLQQGEFRQRQPKKKNTNIEKDGDVPEGSFRDRKKKLKHGEAFDELIQSHNPIGIPDGNLKNKQKKEKDKFDPMEFEDEGELNEGQFKERIGKKNTNIAKDADVPEGSLRDRKKKLKQGEAFDQFIESHNPTGIPDGNIKNKQKKEKDKFDPLEFEDEDELEEIQTKQRNQKKKAQDPTKGSNNEGELNEGQFKERIGKKNQEEKSHDLKDQLKEGVLKDRRNHRRNKERINQNNQQQDLPEGQFKDIYKQGKNQQKQGQFNQFQDFNEAKVYDHTSKRHKRNIQKNQDNQDPNIDAKTRQIETKKAQKKNKEQVNDDGRSLEGGNMFDYQGKKIQKGKPKKEENELIKGAKTTELRSKKAAKEEKKNIFEEWMQEEGAQSIVFNDRKKKNTSQFNEFNEELEQSYEDVLRKNKQQLLKPEYQKKKAPQQDEFEESGYSKRSERISQKRAKDRGLGMHPNQSDSQNEDTMQSARRKRSQVQQRLRARNKPMQMNQNDSDAGQQESVYSRNKSRVSKKAMDRKSGILKIRDDRASGDEDLDNIQL